nr:ROK family protein [Bacillus licheniformis]
MNIGRGVGAGIVINGKLYHGAEGIAGELGHMIIDINGEKCECGNRGTPADDCERKSNCRTGEKAVERKH